MSPARVYTRTLAGIQAVSVLVEAHLGGGLPSVAIVGMAETAVKESRDRVKAALNNCGFEFPTQKVVINLAPADLPKYGGRFDLPIALSILVVTGQLPSELLEDVECIGELALSGLLRAVPGVLPTSLGTARIQRCLIVPRANAQEAALSEDTTVYAADSLTEVVQLLHNRENATIVPFPSLPVQTDNLGDMIEVKGQYHVKRAFEIAAAGGHNLLMSGPPGTGKSMLATRLPGIMPAMNQSEAFESAMVASISHKGFSLQDWRKRPFRSPHHTASGVALVGGGSPPRPGEISLAHFGVLFLDELPEFSRGVLDVLREPMESGSITISRASRQSEFPARFQVIAAMNPCPCGYEGDPEISCRCSPDQISRYQSKISGPFLDRIDMSVHVPRVSYREWRDQPNDGETSAVIRNRVGQCRSEQMRRQNCANANLDSKKIEAYCELSKSNSDLLDAISEKLHLSLRAYIRVLRLARTIADLDESEQIQDSHIIEAISYRHRRGE